MGVGPESVKARVVVRVRTVVRVVIQLGLGFGVA